MTIKAIETQYKGYRFRSRLEARWAVFFDALGVKWEYEKEGFDLGEAGWYLPDFWLPRACPEVGSKCSTAATMPFFTRKEGAWVEIKPSVPSDDELAKAGHLAYGSGHEVLIVVGQPWATEYLITSVRSHRVYPIQSELIQCALERGIDGALYALLLWEGWSHPGHRAPLQYIKDEPWYARAVAMNRRFEEPSTRYEVPPVSFQFLLCSLCDSFSVKPTNNNDGLCTACLCVAQNSERDRLHAAYTAARSARFEHGETPKVDQWH